ncbi:16S rRNA pseudouridine(516) synthase [Propionivibrio sp.]|uniref:16S rRNA pseudouridine(516) synthase n=1 Tax=Propionivibrio sp. TaxID=2212460 RepID=UPI0026149AA2|nr:16S rRNA pseudouridine(516) synthase [Propionivibrio sp.]
MQLERLLRSQGFGSRPECRALVYSGRVRVGGNVCDDPFAEYEAAGFGFTVDEEPWIFRKNVYLALNKPGNYECSQKPKHHPSIYSLLPRPVLTRGVQAVGRLDEDTTGLLLLSDDGQFIHTYTAPKKKIPKVYDVSVKHPLNDLQLSLLLAGVQLNDEPAPIAAVACEMRAERLLRMTVTEGKYHLVKRMIAAAGNRVEGLNRISVGGLSLPDDLPVGKWIWLEAVDLHRLRQYPPVCFT